MDYLDEIAREQRNQIEAVEKGFDPFHISPEDIEKGRKAQLGEIRHWKDGDYKMTVNGWEYVKGSDPNIKSKKKSEGTSKEGDRDYAIALAQKVAELYGKVPDDKKKFVTTKALESVAKEILKKEKKIPEKSEEPSKAEPVEAESSLKSTKNMVYSLEEQRNEIMSKFQRAKMAKNSFLANSLKSKMTSLENKIDALEHRREDVKKVLRGLGLTQLTRATTSIRGYSPISGGDYEFPYAGMSSLLTFKNKELASKVKEGLDSAGIHSKLMGDGIEITSIFKYKEEPIKTPEKKEDGKAKYQKLEAEVSSKTKELQSLPGYEDLLNPQNRKKDFGSDKKVKSMHIGIETNYSEGTSHFQVRVGHAEAPMFGEESDKWNKSVNELQSKKFSTAKEAAAAVEEFASKHNTEKILAADAFPKMKEYLNKLNLGFIQIPRDLDSSGKWSEEKSFIVEPKYAGSLQVIYEKITGTSKWGRDEEGNIYGNIHFRWNHVGGGSNGYSVELKFDKSGNLLKTTRG